MKKFVKIISVVMCALLLVTGFFFAPKNMNSFMLSTHAATSQAATGQTYNFVGSVESSSSDIPDYAISDIEYLTYQSYFLLKCTVSCPISWNVFSSSEVVFNAGSGTVQRLVLNFYNDSYYDWNVLFYSDSGSLSHHYMNGNFIVSHAANTTFDLYFSNYYFVLNNTNNDFTLSSSFPYVDNVISVNDTFSVDSDLSYVYDMSSDTNFNLNLNSFITSDKFSSFIFSSLNTAPVYFPVSTAHGYAQSIFDNGNTRFFADEFNSFIGSCYFLGTSFFRYYLPQLYFYIYQPAYRVNNTLVIYNFDYYNYLNLSSGVLYSLRKGNDIYNVSYTGALPDTKFIYVFNDSIQNTIFDEYILFYLKFNDGYINYLDFYDSSVGSLNFPLGFDFNFTYYTQPLVASNGSYNYVFEKPGYVEMPFSLAPFYIPVLEAAENVMIFFLFYCPIISDLIQVLNFDKFLGGLLNIFNMFIDSQIGNFILGCFAFLILWGILSSLLPKALSSARSVYSNSQFVYNRRRNREDRQKERLQQKEVKYTQKMIKVEERYNKRRRKKE